MQHGYTFEQAEFMKVQHQANRWTFLGSGMTDRNFLATAEGVSPGARQAFERMAPVFCCDGTPDEPDVETTRDLAPLAQGREVPHPHRALSRPAAYPAFGGGGTLW